MATILIVDGVEADRHAVSTLLRGYGHRLVEAADTRVGWAGVRDDRPDIVMTAVSPPVMDCYAFVRRLRLQSTTCTIPLIFTATPENERHTWALAIVSGVLSILMKPLVSGEVLTVVDQVLSGAIPREMLPDTTLLSVTHDVEPVRRRLRRAFKERLHRLVGGDLSIGAHIVRNMSGDERMIEWRTSVLRDDTGVVIGTLASSADLTDRAPIRSTQASADACVPLAVEAAGGATYDINDLLTVMVENCDRLLVETDHADPRQSERVDLARFVAAQVRTLLDRDGYQMVS